MIARLAALSAAAFTLAACSSTPTGPAPTPAPRIEQRPAADAPPVPNDMKVTCLADPNQTAPSPTCPVLVYGSKAYWAFSFGDNRSAFGIVGYENDVATGRIERAGARYVYSMTVNEADSTVTITGQSGLSVTVGWTELP